MAVLGTFSSFTTARLGIYASQTSLQVTGNNIANINTTGYTRQRADLYSLNSTGTSKYANPLGVDIGYGVLVKSTTQLRDPYLDIRYRNENAKLGAANATLKGLMNMSQSLDEVNQGTSQNGRIEDCLMNFKSMLEGLSKQVGSEEQDGLVREAAKSLTTFFNTAAKALEEDWNLQKDELEDTVKTVNDCLTNIRNLNEQIRKQGIYGDMALELRDHRNLEIDKLSEYLAIDVEYSMERIDQYSEVEKLTIYLKDTVDPRSDPEHPTKIKLVDGLYAGQLSISDLESNPAYNAGEKQTPQLNPNWTEGGTVGKYIGEDNQPTDDINKANMLKMNPDFEKGELLRNPAYPDTQGSLPYLDDEGQPTDDVSKAARVVTNPAYSKSVPVENPEATGPDERYYAADGSGFTGDVNLAKRALKNPDYDPEVDGSLPYLAADGTTPADAADAGHIGKYMTAAGGTTDDITAAKKVERYVDEDGNLTSDPTKAAKASRKYLTDPKYVGEIGTETNDPEKAAKVDPNTFLFQVERLEDKFGRPLDKGKDTESVIVPLDDNDLAGALQAMRELLTEEGEFASKNDVGIAYANPNDALKAMGYTDAEITAMGQAGIDQALKLLERSADENANIKMGIPYYQKRLDLLAQRFAQIFNEANQMPASTVYESAVPANGDATQFVKKNADGTSLPVTDSTGTIITWGDVTVEVAVLDSDGNAVTDDNGVVTERLPLDSPSARTALTAKLKAENPTMTDEQIKTAVDTALSGDKIDRAVECLEILREMGLLKSEYYFYDGGVLFSNNGNNNDPTGITAKNITISNSWAARTVRVLNTKQPDILLNPNDPDAGKIEHSSLNDNINHMISIFEQKMDYSASEVEPDAAKGDQVFFQGSIQEMYTNMGATLGSQTSMMNGVAYNYEILTLNIDNNRLSVSGVDLNDEATSMMQFQKSYQAACRLLTTIDSMLDTLINGTLR